MRMRKSLVVLVTITFTIAAAADRTSQTTDSWGEPVDGIQLQLILSDGPQRTGMDVLPPFQIRFRNQGALSATYLDALTMCVEIEMDGVWLFPDPCVNRTGTTVPSSIQIPAGGRSELLAFHPESSLPPAGAQNARFELKPGRHTVRIRAQLADGDCGRIIRGPGTPYCFDRTGKAVSIGTSKVIGVLTSNPVTFDFPVGADTTVVAPPQCGAERGRRAEGAIGGVERGETFTQTRSNSFGYDGDSGWILKLVPVDSGWLLQVAARGREDEDLARLTTPLHGSNPRELHGWHFRNADNTAQNDGSTNAPGLVREFIFSPAVGREIQGATATHKPTSGEIDAVRSFGRGWLFITSYRLTPPRKGEQAAFESLTFQACLSWPFQ